MDRYGDWAPTDFDRRGAFLDDRADWLVFPCMRTRDSRPLEESNFQSALKQIRAVDPDGFACDVDRGFLVGYVKKTEVGRFVLTTWHGETLVGLERTGYARGFNRTTLECFRTVGTFAGYYWHGRGLGEGMMLRLRRGRKA